MSKDMSYSEAAKAVKALLHQFRGLKTIGEVFEEAAKAQSNIKAYEDLAAQAKAEYEAAKKTTEQMKAACEATAADYDAKTADVVAEYKAVKAQYDAFVSGLEVGPLVGAHP